MQIRIKFLLLLKAVQALILYKPDAAELSKQSCGGLKETNNTNLHVCCIIIIRAYQGFSEIQKKMQSGKVLLISIKTSPSSHSSAEN